MMPTTTAFAVRGRTIGRGVLIAALLALSAPVFLHAQAARTPAPGADGVRRTPEGKPDHRHLAGHGLGS